MLLEEVARFCFDLLVVSYEREMGYSFPEEPMTVDLYPIHGKQSKIEPIGSFYCDKIGGDKKAVYRLYKSIKEEKELIEFTGKYPGWYAECLGYNDFIHFLKANKLNFSDATYSKQLEYLRPTKQSISIYGSKQLFYYFYMASPNGGYQSAILGISDDMKYAEMLSPDRILLNGDVSIENPFLSITLWEEDNGNYIAVKQTLNVKCFFGSSSEVEYKNVIPVVYSGILDRAHGVAGGGLLVRCELEEQYSSLAEVPLSNHDDDYNIISQLQNQLIVTPSTTYNDLASLPRAANYEKARRYVGTYKSYILSKLESSLRISVIRINEDLTAECRSNQNNIYQGYVEVTTNGPYYLWLHFKRPEAQSKEKFTVVLSMPSDGQSLRLFGVYSGVSIYSSIMGGREIFVKVSDDPSEYDKMEALIYPTSSEEYKSIVEEDDFIIPYFSGNDERNAYLDNTHRFLEAPHNKSILITTKVDDYDLDRIARIAGVYKSYHVNQGGQISCSIWELKKDFTYRVRRPTGKEEGVIKLKDDVMELAANEGERTKSRFLFSIGNHSEYKILEGLYSMISTQWAPQGGRSIFIRQSEKQIDLKPHDFAKNDIAILKSLNSLHKGLDTYLLGQIDNCLLPNIRVNQGALERGGDYGAVYFNSACYLASFENKDGEISKLIIKQLRLAFENGFRSVERVEQMIKSDVFFNLGIDIDTEKWEIVEK